MGTASPGGTRDRRWTDYTGISGQALAFPASNSRHARKQAPLRVNVGSLPMITRVGCCLVALLATSVAAGSGPAAPGSTIPTRQRCPNPDFREGLAHWSPYPSTALVKVKPLPRHAVTGGASSAAEIDARTCSTEAGVVSDRFAVEPLAAYRLGGLVKRLAGEGAYKISLEWLDGNSNHLGYENSWTGVLIGSDWERHRVQVLSPPAARFAKVLAGVAAGCACQMTNLEVAPQPRPGPNLSIDLLADPVPPPPGGEARLGIRIENRGGPTAKDAQVKVGLPAGLQSTEALTFAAGDLTYSDVFFKEIPLDGSPADPEEPITCTVAAQFDNKELTFTAATKPFVTVATEVETPTEQLGPPVLPDMSVKLGCYYFPVMLDWDRAGWGVRRVPYLRPRLGYYDEASPEVADWHIRWAVDHGISFFVFDWYYNQGFCYLNDALEQGFLKSRFADRMQFCVDWCNEGQCQEFKPLDFSNESLADFMRLLCERYFRHRNYLRVAGKPVVLIHQADRIVNAHGGWKGCRLALDRMRAIARGYGHPGVYFVAVQNNPWLLDYAKGGFDCVTAYTYGFCDVPWGGPDRSLPYAALLPRFRERFAIARERAHAQGLDYIPTAWVGWDDAGRAHENAVRTAGNTPAAFRRMLESLPPFVDRRPGLALFEAWNEWGEGSVAEPGTRYGFGYLEAVRDVLTRARGPYRVPAPTATDVQRFGTTDTFDDVNDVYYRRYAAKLGLDHGLRLNFDSVRGLWLLRGRHMANVRIERGCLRGQSTGEDPGLLGPPCMGIDARGIRSVAIRMAVTSGKEGQLFWSTEDDRNWSEDRSLRFHLVADGQMHEYLLNVSSHPGWVGKVRQFRFDPTDAPADIRIDWFRTIPDR